MLVKIYSAAPVGIDAVQVTIEVHSKPGFDFVMVGLPDTSVKESHERIMSALTVNGLEGLHRAFTINMAPADIKKEGSAFDLPLAVGLLAGAEKLKTKELEHYMIMGELSLDGSLQPIRGALPIALCARREGFKGLILPAANAEEAAVVDGLEVYGLNSLIEVVRFLDGQPKDELNPDEPWTPTHVDTQALFDELAYLHPNYFIPNPDVLSSIGLKSGEKFFILRFNAFKAHHDVGVHGLSIENKRRLVELLKREGRVIITTERNIDDEFLPYKLSVSQEQIHNLMYYATMLIGDSQTMTSEAALLGTPAIKCNSFAGRLAVPNEIEKEYGLCYSYLPEQSDAFFDKIKELLLLPDLKMEFQKRRQKMLADKIDVTAFFTWFIENYPKSAKESKENANNENFWKQFK